MLVATVVGSGIMADRLTNDVALSLLGNTIPTGAILVVLITILGPISGAHFNPAVTMVFALRRDIEANAALFVHRWADRGRRMPDRFIAHAMFELPIIEVSATVRTGTGQWIAEVGGSLRSRLYHPCRPSHFGRMQFPGWSDFTHGRLLVHRLDIVCQSSRRNRACPVEHFRRYPARRLAWLYHCRVPRRIARNGADQVGCWRIRTPASQALNKLKGAE